MLLSGYYFTGLTSIQRCYSCCELYLNLTLLSSHAVGSPDFCSKLYLCTVFLLLTLSESNATVLPRGGVSRRQFKALPTVFLLRALSESNSTVLSSGRVSRLQFKALLTVFLLLALSVSNATVLPTRWGLQDDTIKVRIGRQFVDFLSKFWHPTAATPASQTCKTHTK